MINFNVLLKVLYTNGMDEAINTAIKIDLEMTKPADTDIVREVYENKLPEGIRFKPTKGVDLKYGYVKCRVINYDPYRIHDQYFIEYPDGSKEWVSYSEFVQLKPLTPMESTLPPQDL